MGFLSRAVCLTRTTGAAFAISAGLPLLVAAVVSVEKERVSALYLRSVCLSKRCFRWS